MHACMHRRSQAPSTSAAGSTLILIGGELYGTTQQVGEHVLHTKSVPHHARRQTERQLLGEAQGFGNRRSTKGCCQHPANSIGQCKGLSNLSSSIFCMLSTCFNVQAMNSVDPRIIVSVSLDCIDIEIISEEKNLKEGITHLLLLLIAVAL